MVKGFACLLHTQLSELDVMNKQKGANKNHSKIMQFHILHKWISNSS